MASGGFTLADRLGAKSIPCRVPGCTRTWMQLGQLGKLGQQGKKASLTLGNGAPASADDPAAGLCEPCRTKRTTLKDTERRCDNPGCTGTWTWPVAAQLEAFATKRPPPRNLCADCEAKLAALEDKDVPCVVPGCTRTAVLTRRAQLLGAAPEPEKTPEGQITYTGMLCAPCADVAGRITDRRIACGINGCDRHWVWKADDQLQAFAAGKPNEAPRRMCDQCRAEFGKLNDREIRCRTSGCKKIWTWGRNDQLDACVANRPAPKAPSKMCPSCFEIFSGLKDVERPCRRSGCKRTWTDKRGAQLARAVRGKTGDPYPHYCSECEKELGDLQDREIACKTDGCNGTWTWSKEQQLAAGVRLLKPLPPIGEAAAAVAAPDGSGAPAASEGDGAPAAPAVATAAAESAPAPQPEGGKKGKNRRSKRHREPKPPTRLCSTCVEFLTGKKTLEIPCSQCGTPIYWPPESQLQSHLGNWAIPSLCGACKRDATEAARKAAKEALRQQPVVPVHPPEA